jgi:hypothetical protein
MSAVERWGSNRLSRYEDAIEAEIVGRPVLPRPVEQAVTRAVAKQYGRGAVGKARVVTTGQVAEHGLVMLEKLEREETAAIARDPVNAGRRQRGIVDAAAAVFEDAVRTTGAGFQL